MSRSNSLPVRLAAAASVLALGGCMTVGPNFKRPEAPAGAAGSGYAMAGDPAAPGVSLSPDVRAAGPWWQAFGSPELDAVVRQALADSPTLAEANATLQRAQAQHRAARGQQMPQADLTAGYNRERINIQAFGFTGFGAGITNPTINLYSVGGAVAYDLDLFGGRRRTTEEAGARAEYEARRADAAYLSLSGNVALQVMRIASLRAELAAVEAIIADDQRVLDLVRKAERAGGEAPAAIDTATAQLAEDEALAPPLNRDLEAARHQLALLVGKSPSEWSPPDFDFAKMSWPGSIPVSLPSSLIRTRPDILAAEADLHAATAAIGVATANLYPDIRLSANLTQSAIDPSDLFNSHLASGWAIGPGLTVPIFHGGTLRAQKQAAEAEARAALARYQQTVLRAFTEVADLLAALGTDQQSIAALQRAVVSAEASARNAQTAYSLGGGTLLQVTDAQRQLSRTRRSLVAAQGQMYADLVQLYAATATDWRPAAKT
ncbi:MAG TPA: efflux transporter outer membrane subunit [Phenylobacterium sp.]|uniref:efflux transporter outer membrane subunit n=1 Tax=Phenylobacterium sp. TaxID=1871053 RepID=UPI002B466C48|nr:efflux transporter outer membrane subunit [Phenylobacterium sp.]HKR89750.1 efflux transporter outer membrane subunit [Phenylobacterium sp.]